MADYVLIAGGLRRGGNGRFLQSADFFSFVFDAVTSITFNFKSNPTKHKVDSKATVTDHIIQENDVFTLNVIVSDTPVTRVENNSITYGAEGSIKKRSSQALNELKRLKEQGQVFTLATEFGVVSNCVIRSISGVLTPNNINAYQFDIELEKIRIANKQTVVLIANPNIADQVANNTSKGNSDKKEVDDPLKYHAVPTLKGAINSFLGQEIFEDVL